MSAGEQQTPNSDLGATKTSTKPSATAKTLSYRGRLLLAHGALWKGLRYHGRWRRRGDLSALGDVVMAGSDGASVGSRLPSGRPLFALFAEGRTARVELRGDGVRRIAVVHHAKPGAGPAFIVLPVTGRGATVTLRVLSGVTELDAVAAVPAP